MKGRNFEKAEKLIDKISNSLYTFISVLLIKKFYQA